MKKNIFKAATKLVFVVSTFGLLACSNNSNSGSSTPTPVVPVTPLYPNNPYPYNPYSSNLGFYSDNWSAQKSVRITNAGVYKEFLKNAMGVCDRMQNTGGTANCNNWISGGIDIIMQTTSAQSNNLNVTIRTWPLVNQYGTYWYQAPDFGDFVLAFIGVPVLPTAGAYLNPLILNQWTISVVNDSKGFEARSYGHIATTANRSLIQIRVDQGKLEDSFFKYRMGFGNQNTVTGQWFLEGTFQRCNHTDCAYGTPWGY